MPHIKFLKNKMCSTVKSNTSLKLAYKTLDVIPRKHQSEKIKFPTWSSALDTNTNLTKFPKSSTCSFV